jgi:hypothetical protein
MSSVALEAEAERGPSEHDLGVAGPPPHAAATAAVAPDLTGAIRALLRYGWTPQSLKGWVGSLTLHTVLLLSLAFWYFAPRSARPAEFESRMPGSLDGRIDGNQLDGGSNGSPVSLTGELAALEPSPAVIQPEMPVPSPTESPSVNLARSPVTLQVAASVRAEREPARGGGRRPGDGIAGNWGAGNGAGFGLAKFGDGGETIRGVKVRVGDPQFTLIWDTKSVDIDLHVLEPKGDHLYFGNRKGRQGGELDVDNTWGFGPENIYWLVPSGGRKSSKVKGPGPSGAYRWSVHYYAAHRPDSPTVHWQVRIKHAGEAKIIEGQLNSPGEWSQIYELKVHPPKDGDVGGADSDK